MVGIVAVVGSSEVVPGQAFLVLVLLGLKQEIWSIPSILQLDYRVKGKTPEPAFWEAVAEIFSASASVPGLEGITLSGTACLP